ncbi:MAG: hypothetical protein KKA64_03610 [Nanoarchaeota archaeon]|nr:hypothetical protein [Nanoarchaeota archaeon]
MALGAAFLIIGVLIAGIWIILEFKRFRHKFFAIFLILLILFFYVTFSYTIKGKNVDLRTAPGVVNAVKIYFSWLVSASMNVKAITTNAIKMNWGGNQTSGG